VKPPLQLERGQPFVVAAAVLVWERAAGCGPRARGSGPLADPAAVPDMESERRVRWSWGEGWSAEGWGPECERLRGGARSFGGGPGRSYCDDCGGFGLAGSEDCGCCGQGFEQAFQLSCCEGRGGAVVACCKLWQAAVAAVGRKTIEQAAVAERQLVLNNAAVAGVSAEFGDDDWQVWWEC